MSDSDIHNDSVVGEYLSSDSSSGDESSPTASVEFECDGRKFNKSVLRWLPVASAIIPAVTLVASYLTSTIRGTFPYVLPYISHTGNEAPESCIFTLGLSLTSMSLVPIMIIKYYRLSSCLNVVFDPNIISMYPERHTVQGSKDQITEKEFLKSWCDFYNKLSVSFGLLATFGMLLVAAFQENKVSSVHFVGAGLAFVCSNIYMILMMRILYAIKFHYCRKRLFLARSVMTVCSFFGMIGMMIFMQLSNMKWTDKDLKEYRENGRALDIFKPSHPAFLLNLTSSICEWVMAISVFGFISTMYFDFKHVGLDILIEVRKIPGVRVSENDGAPSHGNGDNEVPDDVDDGSNKHKYNRTSKSFSSPVSTPSTIRRHSSSVFLMLPTVSESRENLLVVKNDDHQMDNSNSSSTQSYHLNPNETANNVWKERSLKSSSGSMASTSPFSQGLGIGINATASFAPILKKSNSVSDTEEIPQTCPTASDTTATSQNHHRRTVSENVVISIQHDDDQQQQQQQQQQQENTDESVLVMEKEKDVISPTTLKNRSVLMIADDANHLKCKKCKASCEACTCVNREKKA